MNGKQLKRYETNNSELTLNLNDLPKGMYILEIASEDSQKNQKASKELISLRSFL